MPTDVELLTQAMKQTEALLKAVGANTEKAAGTQTANQLHGFDGLFSQTSERDVVTAHIRPMGIANALPLIASVDEGPIYSSITGYTAASGTQPDNACDDAPTAFMKGCDLTARFGRIRFDTNTIEFDNVMRRINRGDFRDLRLAGQVLGLTNLEPRGLSGMQDRILTILTASEMVTAGVTAERELTRQMWQGTFGANNEFAGLDSLIATGQVDQGTNTACPALDSDVKDFNYNDVAGTNVSIVEYMSMMEWYLYHNAFRSGLLPAEWAIVLRPELWQVLTEVWPCQYNTAKCATSVVGDQSRTIIDGRENIADRDSMRSSMTIEINGRRYRVIEDDGIYEQNNINDGNLIAGQYASSVYFVPLTIRGSLPATWREHLDYNDGVSRANVSLLNGKENFWTDGGQYSWAFTDQKWCYQLHLKTEQRVLLRTPQLAGKIDNVMYEPLQHLRSSDAESPYFFDGGMSLRDTDESFYAIWA